MTTHRDPSKGDEYHHPDGVVEVVFATDPDRVLTVREYPGVAGFSDTVSGATYRGINDDVANLPPAEEFRDDTEDAEDGRDASTGDGHD